MSKSYLTHKTLFRKKLRDFSRGLYRLKNYFIELLKEVFRKAFKKDKN